MLSPSARICGGLGCRESGHCLAMGNHSVYIDFSDCRALFVDGSQPVAKFMFKGATVFPVGEEENKFLCESKGQKEQV